MIAIIYAAERARVCRDARELSRTERVLLMSPASCACAITTGIITVVGNIAPLFPLFFFSFSTPWPRRRRGYLETVRDLPGSEARN